MKNIKSAKVYAAIFLLAAVIQMPAFAQRIVKSFNESWAYRKGEATLPINPDKSWQPVHLPHTWNAVDCFDDERGYYAGIGWYYKTFDIQGIKAGRRLHLNFEAANHTAKVYVNDKFVGAHSGGYTAFSFDITDYVSPGKNTIAVMVDNTVSVDIAPIGADFNFYGGIYREVQLIETGSAYLGLSHRASAGFKFTTPRVDNEQATYTVEVFGKSTSRQKENLKAVIQLSRNNAVLQQNELKISTSANTLFSAKTKDLILKKPELWSPEKPALYLLNIKLYSADGKTLLDESEQEVGFRYYNFDPDKGFSLNGKPLKLLGACRHQDFQGIGNAVPKARHYADMKAIKDFGGNFVRISHYPQDNEVLRACNQLGLLAWEEIPLVNEVGETHKYDSTSLEQLQDMIAQHFNHPSVIIWGYMNEIMIKLKGGDKRPAHIASSIKIAKQLDSLARKLDPSRYTAMALHNSKVYNESGIADIPQIVGWNLYHGWYHDKNADFGKFMDEQKKLYPKRNYIISEYGAGSDERLHSTSPERFDFTTEYALTLHDSYLYQIKERNYIAGAALWNLVDFGSEGRKESMPRINNKGLMTIDRRKKDVWYFYKANLSDEPFAYIASRENTHRKVLVKNGETEQIIVDVFSNGVKAELEVNGKTYQKKNIVFGKTSFKIAAENGPLLMNLTVYDETGKKWASDAYTVHCTIQPDIFKTAKEVDIAINSGSNVFYTDPITQEIWEADKEYKKGSYGFMGGSQYRPGKRPGSQDEITNSPHEPLYQTRRDSLQGYRFDVPDGTYKITMLFAELDNSKKAIVNDLGAVAGSTNSSSKANVFDIVINGTMAFPKTDINKSVGTNRAVELSYVVKAEKNQGIEVKFNTLSNTSFINGIKLKGLN